MKRNKIPGLSQRAEALFILLLGLNHEDGVCLSILHDSNTRGLLRSDAGRANKISGLS
jgi:hypothetical protein